MISRIYTPRKLKNSKDFKNTFGKSQGLPFIYKYCRSEPLFAQSLIGFDIYPETATVESLNP